MKNITDTVLPIKINETIAMEKPVTGSYISSQKQDTHVVILSNREHHLKQAKSV